MESRNLRSRPCFMADSNNKIVVVGLYGIPGSGKTFLLNQLKQELDQTRFAFYEGSEMIASVAPGGLEAFHKMEEPEKAYWREQAIDEIGQRCHGDRKAAIITGHFMFWTECQEAGRSVCTENDLKTYTHIIYLDVPAETIARRRFGDTERSRTPTSVDHLRKWQQEEKKQLRNLCRHRGILFSLVSSQPRLSNVVSTLLRDFSLHNEKFNLYQAESRLDEALADQGQLETVLVMDADRTLAAEDTGDLFWKKICELHSTRDEESSLRELFSSPLGYSYTAFRQAVLLYEEVANDDDFDALCGEVASAVNIHLEFVSLLRLVAEENHIRAVIVTSGLRRIWEKVLEKTGLSGTVQIIGGGRIADGFVVSASVKGALVSRLRETHRLYVWAFGDSPLDLDMLLKADQAIVVVGDEHKRSKTMDAALRNATDNEGLTARQTLLPSNSSPRLDTTKLPLVQFMEPEFVESVTCRRGRGVSLHATHKKAAKLLMTPMRDAAMAGPLLRDIHRRVGYYLAIEFLADTIDLEEYPILHVQGHKTSGHRLFREDHTSVVALMRGGEAIAFGVNDAFPLATFVHANRPEDIKLHHLRETVVLVDSVVNSGRTVVNFLKHIRKLHSTIRVVVLAGVVQAQSILRGELAEVLTRQPVPSLVALRLSDNRFTGSGTTDTGNRLFNTTHLC